MGLAVARFNYARKITNAFAIDLNSIQDDYNKGICSHGSLVNYPVRQDSLDASFPLKGQVIFDFHMLQRYKFYWIFFNQHRNKNYLDETFFARVLICFFFMSAAPQRKHTCSALIEQGLEQFKGFAERESFTDSVKHQQMYLRRATFTLGLLITNIVYLCPLYLIRNFSVI